MHTLRFIQLLDCGFLATSSPPPIMIAAKLALVQWLCKMSTMRLCGYEVRGQDRLKDLTHRIILINTSLSDFMYFPFIKGSVEAQCGLVLNGQGGVIRRGKDTLKHSFLIYYVVLKIWWCF